MPKKRILRVEFNWIFLNFVECGKFRIVHKVESVYISTQKAEFQLDFNWISYFLKLKFFFLGRKNTLYNLWKILNSTIGMSLCLCLLDKGQSLLCFPKNTRNDLWIYLRNLLKHQKTKIRKNKVNKVKLCHLSNKVLFDKVYFVFPQNHRKWPLDTWKALKTLKNENSEKQSKQS